MFRLTTTIGRLARRLHPDSGQTLVEYVMILTFVSITVVAALKLIASPVGRFFSEVGNAFP